MTGPIECRYYGRDFTVREMALLRALIAETPSLNRLALSKAFCRRIGWYKPDGGLKDMMARVAMLAMHRDGRIALPPPRCKQNRAGPIAFGPDTDAPLEPPPDTLDEVRPIRLRTVLGATPQSRQWNAFIARYHYLGYKTLVGAQMRYTVHDRHGHLLALLGFSTAARTLAPRDRFIGWTPALREKNLPLAIDNAPLPHPALDPHPQPRLAHPVRRLPATARGLDRALQHYPRAHRNVRGDPTLHRRHLQGLRMGPCRHHPGTRALRPAQEIRQAEKEHLASPPQKRLETHAQPVSQQITRSRNAYAHTHRTGERLPPTGQHRNTPNILFVLLYFCPSMLHCVRTLLNDNHRREYAQVVVNPLAVCLPEKIGLWA